MLGVLEVQRQSERLFRVQEEGLCWLEVLWQGGLESSLVKERQKLEVSA